MDIQPSPPPRKRRSRPSILSCLGGACILFFAGLFAWFIFASYMLFRDAIRISNYPHQDVYANLTHPDIIEGKVGLVHPLIEADTVFDLVITIWARNPIDQSYADQIQDDAENGRLELSLQQQAVVSFIKRPVVEILEGVPSETMLASKIVENFSLKERDRVVEVDYELPLARMYVVAATSLMTKADGKV
jgi:hypothetical protein